MSPVQKLILVLALCSQLDAWADTCPLPPNSIDPSVSANVSFDKKTSLYTYRYDVLSGRASQLPIHTFILQISQAPASVQAPEHWLHDFMNTGYMPTHLWWGAVPSSRYKSVEIAPGSHLTGFSLTSPYPPGVVQFNAEGRTGVPSSSPPPEGSLDDEPEPNCPDWDFNSPRFKTLVTGITTGPVPPDTTSISMRVREEKGNRSASPIDPKALSGNISVLILATKSFDPSQLAVSSIKLGPEDATPIASKLVASRDDDDRDNEREEWERLSTGVGHIHDLDKDAKKQNLLLTFNQASLGVRCVLDKAIFLTGKTLSGVSVIGGASVQLAGCDIRHPGRRPLKPDPKELESERKRQHRIERAKGIKK